MNLRGVLTDETGATPVVGVILLIAVTVVLGSAVATMGIGLGDRVRKTPPNAKFSFEYEESATAPASACDLTDAGASGVLNVTHQAGDTVDLQVSTFTIADQDGNEPTWTDCGGATTSSSKVAAGHSAYLHVDADDRLRLVWERADKTAVVARWAGPDT